MKINKIPFHGLSMWPTLRDGDQLIVDFEKDREKLFIGEIILSRDPSTEEWVAHRVISTNPLVTKGDRALYKDDWKPVPMGVVSGWIRGDKTLVWGDNGQHLKCFRSFLCKMNRKGAKKYIRYFCLFSLLFLSWIETFLLAKKDRT